MTIPKLPQAYVDGYQEFYGRKFSVTRDVLIPRPETEILVEAAMLYTDMDIIYEIGTGSGCIGITLSLEADCMVHARDVSGNALKVARDNAKNLGCKKIKFIKKSLLDGVEPARMLVVANLPYLTEKELEEPSIYHEPRLALWGGGDGFEIYRRLIEQFQKVAERGSVLLLEIGYNQREICKVACQKICPLAELIFVKDLLGYDRVAALKV